MLDYRSIIDCKYSNLPLPRPADSLKPDAIDMEVKTYQQEQLALYLLGYLLDKFSGDDNMHSLKRYGLLQTNILFNNSALEPN